MTFDPTRAWSLNPQVSIRPEPFGALAYHFGTRRLSFLKSPELRDLVISLEEHPTAREAIAAREIPEVERPRYEAALGTLAGTGMITEGSKQTSGAAA